MNSAIVGTDLFYHSSCDDALGMCFLISQYLSLFSLIVSVCCLCVLVCVIIALVTDVLILINVLSMYMFVLYVNMSTGSSITGIDKFLFLLSHNLIVYCLIVSCTYLTILCCVHICTVISIAGYCCSYSLCRFSVLWSVIALIAGHLNEILITCILPI